MLCLVFLIHTIMIFMTFVLIKNFCPYFILQPITKVEIVTTRTGTCTLSFSLPKTHNFKKRFLKLLNMNKQMVNKWRANY